MKNLIYLLIVISLANLFLIGINLLPTDMPVYEYHFIPKPKSITLMFVGDIMLSRGVGAKMQKEQNYKWPFLKISNYLQQADLLFGNLEGPISDKCCDRGNKYSFRADPKAMQGLKHAGFDILSIANNHIYDWGAEAKQDTIVRLKQENILPVGFEEKPVIQIKNTKISFSAYTYPLPKKIELPDADIKIVSMHIGIEYKKRSSEEQQNFAKKAIDAGADLVIGHHPHVTQEIEKYKDKFIFYSLGNFVFDQQFSEDVKHGWIAKIILEKNKIKSAEAINIYNSKNYQPSIVE